VTTGPDVIEFDGEADLLERFLELPAALHASEANWIANPDERRWLSAVAQRKFIARRSGRVQARCAVTLNPRLCDPNEKPYAQIGFFESADDPAAAAAVLGAALHWLRSNEPAAEYVLAPIDYDTWHAYRLRTSGYDQPTFLMEPWNPAYYPGLMAAAGFQPAARYVTKSVAAPEAMCATWAPYHDRARTTGFTFRSFDHTCAPEELSLVYRLSLPIFRENLFFADTTEAEFRALYSGAAGALDPELLVFVLDAHGSAVGFAFAMIDHRLPDTANLKTMGVLPHVNGTGVGAALACEIYRRMLGKGVQRVNHCLMRVGNRADQFDRGQGAVTREYTLYARPLRI
jgi:hypothetical protein